MKNIGGKLFLAGLMMMAAMTMKGEEPEPVPVFDLHSDILLRAINNDVLLGDPPAWTQVNIPTMKEGHVKNQVFAVWVNSYGVIGPAATRRALQMIDIYHRQQEKYGDDIQLARNMAEADSINADGKIAIWLWLEGGAPIDDDLSLLRIFHQLGVRGMTLTWSNNLLWAGSSTDREDAQMGLSDFGKEVVREMNRIGMIVDISHVSEATFNDVIEISTDPIVASHSSARALCDHPRNLSDDQLRALAKNGGVIGINALPSYLSEKWTPAWEATEASLKDEIAVLKEKYGGNTSDPGYREGRRQMIQAAMPEEGIVTLDTYLDHIDHAVKIAGWEHVGLGSDFDGIWAFPVGLEKASKWQSVVDGLRDRGYEQEKIDAIMHGNMTRVFREVIDR